MGLNVIDASISIALVDEGDELHATSRRAVLTDPGALVLPASAYAETMIHPHRQGTAGDVRQVLQTLGIRVEPLTEAMADEAARLRARHRSLRLADALIIATAAVLEADVLLTGDRRLAGTWERVRVLAP